MLQEKIDIQEGGREFTVKQHIVQNNMDIMEFNKMLRGMSKDQRRNFKRQTRLLAVIPFYQPRGMFKAHETAIDVTRDKDKLDYLLREAPEFLAVDDPLKKKGGKIVVAG